MSSTKPANGSLPVLTATTVRAWAASVAKMKGAQSRGRQGQGTGVRARKGGARMIGTHVRAGEEAGWDKP